MQQKESAHRLLRKVELARQEGKTHFTVGHCMAPLPEVLLQWEELESIKFHQTGGLPENVHALSRLPRLRSVVVEFADFSPDLCALTQIEELKLRSAALKQPESYEFHGMKKLKKLQLGSLHQGGQRVTDISGLSLWELPALEELSLDLLLSELPPELGELTGLRSFILRTWWPHDEEPPVLRLPETLAQWQQLERFGCRLPLAQLPEWLQQWKALRRLDLLRSVEDPVLPDWFGGFSQLEELSIRAALPPTIGDLSKLQKLTLYHSNIEQLPPSFGQLTELRSCFLSSNPLSAFPEVLLELPALEVLHLNHAQIEALPDPFVAPALLELELSSNAIASFPSRFEAPKLRRLKLRSTGLESLPESFADHLPALEELELCSNRLTALPASLGKLQHLQELQFRWNQVQEKPAFYEALSETKIDDLGNPFLQNSAEGGSVREVLPDFHWIHGIAPLDGGFLLDVETIERNQDYPYTEEDIWWLDPNGGLRDLWQHKEFGMVYDCGYHKEFFRSTLVSAGHFWIRYSSLTGRGFMGRGLEVESAPSLPVEAGIHQCLAREGALLLLHLSQGTTGLDWTLYRFSTAPSEQRWEIVETWPGLPLGQEPAFFHQSEEWGVIHVPGSGEVLESPVGRASNDHSYRGINRIACLALSPQEIYMTVKANPWTQRHYMVLRGSQRGMLWQRLTSSQEIRYNELLYDGSELWLSASWAPGEAGRICRIDRVNGQVLPVHLDEDASLLVSDPQGLVYGGGYAPRLSIRKDGELLQSWRLEFEERVAKDAERDDDSKQAEAPQVAHGPREANEARADLLFACHRWSQAEALYRELYAAHGDPRLLWRQARCLKPLGEASALLELLDGAPDQGAEQGLGMPLSWAQARAARGIEPDEEVYRRYQKALDQRDDPELRFEQLQLSQEPGRAGYLELLDVAPTHLPTLRALAFEAWHQGRWEEVLQWAGRALDGHRRELPMCRLALLAARRLERLELALEFARRWSRLAPLDPHGYEEQMLLLEQLDRTEEAEAVELLYFDAKRYASTHSFAQNWLSSGTNLANVEARLREALHALPEVAPLRLAWAQLCFVRGEFPEAIACCEEVLDAEPEHQDALFQQACFCLSLGRPDEALQRLEQLPQSYREASSGVWYHKALALKATGADPLEVLEAYSRAIELQPDHAFALNNRAYELYHHGAHDLALEDVRASLHWKPSNGPAWQTLASILAASSQEEDRDEAIEALQKAMECGTPAKDIRESKDFEPLRSHSEYPGLFDS